MPEYLAPGVYVEEVSFRNKSIEGVSTTTTGFVGPARYGPVDLEPDIITSLVEFERIYGDREPLIYNGAERHNYLGHAVRLRAHTRALPRRGWELARAAHRQARSEHPLGQEGCERERHERSEVA